MGIGDIRYTVLQIVNETQRALGLSETPTLTANKLAVQMVDFINEVCDDLSDFGNWQEVFTSTNVTAVSGQRDYSINTSANIKNLGDIFFSQCVGPLRNITPHDMRIMTRVTITGTPTQFCVFGTDSNGNPLLRVRPTPAASQAGGLFSITYYIRPPEYTTSDPNLIVPFPANIMTNGVWAKAILNESGGSPTDHYTMVQNNYLESRKKALNRFNGDTGYDIAFTPSNFRGRR